MKYAFFLLFFPFLVACQRHYPVTPKSSYVDTRWTYKDAETQYEITFLYDGTMAHSKEGDFTPGNDYWYERNGTLYFFMNKGYARYTGHRTDSATVEGTARNRPGVTWEWEMRITHD